MKFGEMYRRAFGAALDAAGFERSGKVWALSGSELQRSVDFETLLRGSGVDARLGIRFGDVDVVPEPEDCELVMFAKLRKDFLSNDARDALNPKSDMEDCDRIVILQRLAESFASFAASLNSIDDVRRARADGGLFGAYIGRQAELVLAPERHEDSPLSG